MSHHPNPPPYDQYGAEKKAGLIASVIAIVLLAGIILIIEGLGS